MRCSTEQARLGRAAAGMCSRALQGRRRRPLVVLAAIALVGVATAAASAVRASSLTGASSACLQRERCRAVPRMRSLSSSTGAKPQGNGERVGPGRTTTAAWSRSGSRPPEGANPRSTGHLSNASRLRASSACSPRSSLSDSSAATTTTAPGRPSTRLTTSPQGVSRPLGTPLNQSLRRAGSRYATATSSTPSVGWAISIGWLHGSRIRRRGCQ